MGQLRTRCGAEDIVSKKNSSGSTIVLGSIVKLTTTEDTIALPGASTDSCFGIVREDIADGAYGNIQTHGLAIIKAGGSVAVGDDIMPTTAGKGVTWSAGAGTNAALIGKANTAASADEYFECELAGPGNIKQG